MGTLSALPDHREGKSIDHMYIPLTEGQWCGSFMFLLLAWTCFWTKRRVAGETGRHDACVISL